MSTGCFLCPAKSTSLAASRSRSDCLCIAGFHRNATVDSHCQACPAGKFRPDSSTVDCLQCPRYMISVRGSTQCSCDAQHRGHDCLITKRLPVSPEDRAFFLEVQLRVNSTHLSMGQDLESFLKEKLTDFFSLDATERLALSISGNSAGRRQDGVLHAYSGMQTISVIASLVRNRDYMALRVAYLKQDLKEWLGSCCGVVDMQAHCGTGHQPLTNAIENQTSNVSWQGSCMACPLGYHKRSLGRSSCLACPYSKTSMLPGATNESMCICRRGYILSDEGDDSGAGLDRICMAPGQVTEEQAAAAARTVSLVVGTALITIVASTVGATVSWIVCSSALVACLNHAGYLSQSWHLVASI